MASDNELVVLSGSVTSALEASATARPARRQFQHTDSRFDVRYERGSWFVVESWWQIDRRGESEERDQYSAPFASREAAQMAVAS